MIAFAIWDLPSNEIYLVIVFADWDGIYIAIAFSKWDVFAIWGLPSDCFRHKKSI